MNIKITFTDGLVELHEDIESATFSSPESFLDVIQDRKNDHSYDLMDIASIEIHVQEMK